MNSENNNLSNDAVNFDGDDDDYDSFENDENSLIGKIFNFLDFIKLVFIIIIFTQTFFYRTMQVNGESMLNTLKPNDSLGVSNFLYFPKNSDIVIINTFETLDLNIVKRIVALEGQTIDIDQNGNVFVDNVKLNEIYIKPDAKTQKFPHGVNPANLKYPIKIPTGYFFAMGDNRAHSSDSREFGLFKLDQILGKVVLRWWPLQSLKFFN